MITLKRQLGKVGNGASGSHKLQLMTGQVSHTRKKKKQKFKRFRCHSPITIIAPSHTDGKVRYCPNHPHMFTANIAF